MNPAFESAYALVKKARAWAPILEPFVVAEHSPDVAESDRDKGYYGGKRNVIFLNPEWETWGVWLQAHEIGHALDHEVAEKTRDPHKMWRAYWTARNLPPEKYVFPIPPAPTQESVLYSAREFFADSVARVLTGIDGERWPLRDYPWDDGKMAAFFERIRYVPTL